MYKHHFNDWTICGYHNYVPDLGQSVELGQKLIGVTPEIPATVPGSVYQDLERYGYIPSPLKDMNSLACEWVANRWWVYEGCILSFKKKFGKVYRLVLEGIDYEADIFFNGVNLGTQTGMFIPFVKDVTELVKDGEPNWIIVRLHHAPPECGQIGYSSRVKHLKCRFNYKWDFSTRLVNLGLYGDVYLTEEDTVSVIETDIQPVFGDPWDLNARFILKAEKDRELEISIALNDGETCIAAENRLLNILEGETEVVFHTPVKNPQLWYPNGHGAAKLYQLRFSWKGEDGATEEKTYQVGFRTLSYCRPEGAGEEVYCYVPVINGKKIYIKGLNFVPTNLLAGCTTDEYYQSLLRKIKNAGVNLLRVWGGGMIESPLFYQLCDQYGIMVWQEFPMSSSGCDNLASKDPEFVEKLCVASELAIKEKRNHVSLTFWSGGNEICSEDFVDQPDRNDHPVDFSDSTIAALRDLVLKNNPEVYMLPSSASGPLSFLNLGRPGENHDVHGPWQYGGLVNHYIIYNQSDSMLHSEFGCDGMSAYDSLKEFMSPEHIQLKDTKENMVWRHHGGEWWDAYAVREKVIFGDFAPDELPEMIKCSQFIQAEGIRYAVQANRRRQPMNVGSIIWQCNEPWPNVSCTTVMDYYQREKLSYYFLSDAFREVDVSLRYDKLAYQPGEMFAGRVFIANDGKSFSGRVRCVLRYGDQEQVLFNREVTAPENAPAELGAFECKIDENWKGSFRISVFFDGDERVSNDYLFLLTDGNGLHSREAVEAFFDAQMEMYRSDPRFV
ncbi:MAG: hypothetical protein IJY82_03765 [Oscillospiraceae bacterium]|nr:hypothetical protein [Oscillospiraceae bacterium]